MGIKGCPKGLQREPRGTQRIFKGKAKKDLKGDPKGFQRESFTGGPWALSGNPILLYPNSMPNATSISANICYFYGKVSGLQQACSETVENDAF